MSTITISFEAPEEVPHELDGAASLQHRDRDAILRDALEQYLASDREFTAMVEREFVKPTRASWSTIARSKGK